MSVFRRLPNHKRSSFSQRRLRKWHLPGIARVTGMQGSRFSGSAPSFVRRLGTKVGFLTFSCDSRATKIITAKIAAGYGGIGFRVPHLWSRRGDKGGVLDFPDVTVAQREAHCAESPLCFSHFRPPLSVCRIARPSRPTAHPGLHRTEEHRLQRAVGIAALRLPIGSAILSVQHRAERPHCPSQLLVREKHRSKHR